VPLPRQVFGHGWVFFKGERMSKSLGNIVDPLDAAKRHGPDPLRLYLTKEVPYGGDGDFTWERFEEKYNADLANNLGNLVNRVAAMTERYRQGRLTARGGGSLVAVAAEAVRSYTAAMDRLALHDGVAAAYRLISAANEFIADTQPWTLAKNPSDADRLSGVLDDAAEAVRIAAVLLLPVMPSSAAEILRRVGEPDPPADLRFDTATTWRASGERAILNAGALWPRLVEREPGHNQATGHAPTLAVTHSSGEPVSDTNSPEPTGPEPAAAAPAAAAPPVPAAAGSPAPADSAVDDRISIDDFMKVQLKAAKILDAARVPKSKKLVQLSVDVGEAQPRTILAGIAESYEPEHLVGRTVVVVANLKPAKLMGIESNGMVLAASPEGGGALLLNAEPATPGTRVR
ncbi:MAG: methionine--tRNA ligase subunit beta, partial [Acidobacteriota bacterium]|nr:methionine--tRNA ligase subunit beta [Acidobacteriota bacterium]